MDRFETPIALRRLEAIGLSRFGSRTTPGFTGDTRLGTVRVLLARNRKWDRKWDRRTRE
jgi:hypothetical protein